MSARHSDGRGFDTRCGRLSAGHSLRGRMLTPRISNNLRQPFAV